MANFVRSLLTLIILTTGISPHASAHPKTDVIILYNGDKITGELVSMYGGIVELKTDALGTAKIEWKRIARIESIYHYDIRFSTGERHFATIAETSIPGQLKLLSEGTEHNYEMLEVVEIRVVEGSFLGRIDVYLSAGYSYTKASSVGQATFNTDVNYEDENTRNSLTGRSTVTDTNEEVTSSTKWDLSRQVWTDRSKSYRTFYGRYEANDELSLDGRYTAGAGLGRYFVDTQRIRWMASLGLQVITEKANESEISGAGSGSAESIEGFLSTSFAAWRFDTPELDVDIQFNLFPSFSESGRLRGDTDIRIRWELVEDLFWDTTTFVTYDNKSDISHEVDYGITTGIGWSY
jgi:hypothetical protein